MVQYKYKPGYLSEESSNELVVGFIAEDIDEKYPVATNYNKDGLPESWNVKMIVPPMLALIQDHYKELNSHRAEIETLKNRLESMEYKLQQAFEKIAEK